MNADQHNKAKNIFLNAIELNPEEIESYINNQTNDPEIIKQVLDLVNTYQTNTQYTQDYVSDVAENIGKSPLLFPSERYTLIKKVGQGGMGDVYLAQRTLKDIKQKVAIKILQFQDQLTKSRFSQEASILSQLSHPNISQFIDADFLSDGRPYVVMEFTEGKSITEYCQSNNIDIKGRLKLFNALCQAVEHAHRNLIIHRDIKPENILVNDQGHLMLLDFGIAKIIQESDHHTKTQMHAMTPAYASPEQFMGKPVSVASDVYSLGVVLYELLTDCRPNEPKDHSPVEFEKLLRTTKPTKPSLNVQQPHWQSILTGDLDKITLKSLQFDLNLRYKTVAELSDDLNRYHIDLPVLANTPSIGYRAKKFIKRNKLLVFTGLFVLGFISIFMTIILQQNSAIKKQADELIVQRDQAQREQERAETLSDTFVQAFKMADLTKTEGKEISAKDILRQSIKLIKNQNITDPQLSAKLIIAIAEVNRNISESQKSLELILSIEPDIKYLNKEIQNKLLYEKAKSLSKLDRIEEAIKILEDLVSKTNNITYLQLGLAQLYMVNGRDELSKDILMKLHQHLQVDSPFYLSVCTNYGKVQRGMGEIALAEETLFQCQQTIESQSENFEQLDKLALFNQLALVYRSKGELDKSTNLHKRLVTMNSRIFGIDHINTAKVYVNIANNLKVQGKFDESNKYNLIYLEKSINHYGNQHSHIAYPHYNLANNYNELGNYKDAKIHYLKAIKYFEDNGKGSHKNIAFFFSDLANLYLKTEDYESAIDVLIKSSKIFLLPAFPEKIRYTDTQILLSQTYLKIGEKDKAKSIFEKSYPFVLDKYKPEEDPLDKVTWDIANELSKAFQTKR